MTYKPNTNDPRVRRRIEHALDWSLYNLKETEPRSWYTRYLDQHLGYLHRDLGRYLRDTLLITHNRQWNMHTGDCKQYLLNAQGVKDLCMLLGLPLPTRYNNFKKQRVLQHAKRVFGHAIDSGIFDYEDKSDRLWNPIQNLPNAVRSELFHQYGYWYEYDIVSAAATIIPQYARQLGLNKSIDELDQYLANPRSWRDQLARELGCDLDQAKRIINAKFAGAKLGMQNSLAEYLNHDRIKMWRLKNSKQFERLTRDIKQCWDVIKINESRTRLNCRDKWMIYFKLERQVMGVIQRELKAISCRYFLEHDGWRCDRFVIPDEIETKIKHKTGFVIELEWNKSHSV